MSKMIEVQGLTKKYGDFAAVDDMSFDVQAGSIFGFLGPNGAGKSSTINTLSTITAPTSGKVTINGHDVTQDQEKVRSDIGIVFQESTLDESLTVKENLEMHCSFYRVPKDQVAQRIHFVLDLVDLLDWQDTLAGGLSGGMKRRVEIARALVHDPKVLFLDEPTTGLDPQTRANIWEYIQKLQKEKQMTIFLTTHYMDEAEICSEIVVMDHGQVVAQGTPEALKANYTSTQIILETPESDSLNQDLESLDVHYTYESTHYLVHVADSQVALKVLNKVASDGIEFEVKKGTMNDVFLTITGREIRD